MNQNLTGLKIRNLRKRNGVTQGELARRAGISPSYLNLIELNKRAVGGALVDRVAAGLGVERSELDGEAERLVVDSLEEIAADSEIAGRAGRTEPAAELVGRNPGWAGLLLNLYRAYLDRNQAALALADRLNRDPFLGESVHRVLTNVTSIRSAAEILTASDRLAPEDHARFLDIITTDSERLSGTAQSLAAFFDSAHMRVRSATPMEHVDAFIFETDNYFQALEDQASAFRVAHPDVLEAAAGRTLPKEDLSVAEPLVLETPERRQFRVLMDALRDDVSGPVQSLVADHPALSSEESRDLAAAALHAYAAAAVLMPYDTFLEAAERRRYDLDALSRIFGVSYEQAAHRLATLRRPGAEGVRFAFMRSDASGYVTKRLPLPRLPLPRYGNACPLWVIHSAFQSPGVTARSFGELPSGEQFLFFARAVEKRPPAPPLPRHLLSVMLVCSAADAGRVVYGDGIDRTTAMTPVGTICRMCRRVECGHRQEPLLIA